MMVFDEINEITSQSLPKFIVLSTPPYIDNNDYALIPFEI